MLSDCPGQTVWDWWKNLHLEDGGRQTGAGFLFPNLYMKNIGVRELWSKLSAIPHLAPAPDEVLPGKPSAA